MPSYTVISANFTLTAEQESAIAVAITEAHQVNAKGPGFLAQVLFTPLAAGKTYIGGKPYKTPHLFVLGQIRAGRTAEVKAGLVTEITATVRQIAGIGPEDIWVYIQDVPAGQMAEFGRILPELGHEEPWRAGFGAEKLKQLVDAGVTV